MQTRCLFCGNQVKLVFVHGHYQCPVCNTNALPCCDGDNCNNAFLEELPQREADPMIEDDKAAIMKVSESAHRP
jgi:hypothetical protein